MLKLLTMTPKEKAIELVNSFYPILGGIEPKDWEYFCHDKAKKCALIAVAEILNFIEDDRKIFNWKNYYQEVKQEIENL